MSGEQMSDSVQSHVPDHLRNDLFSPVRRVHQHSVHQLAHQL